MPRSSLVRTLKARSAIQLALLILALLASSICASIRESTQAHSSNFSAIKSVAVKKIQQPVYTITDLGLESSDESEVVNQIENVRSQLSIEVAEQVL